MIDLNGMIIENIDYENFIKNNQNQKIYFIYGHLNNLTNMWYIGQTSQKVIYKRFGNNGRLYLRKKKSGVYEQPKFANAILKYGWENFSHYLLDIGLEKDIDELETKWIKEKDSVENGYNGNYAGKQNHKIHTCKREYKKRGPLSEEIKKKISNSIKNSKKCQEVQKNILSKYFFKKGKDNPMYNRHDLNFVDNLGGIKFGKDNSFYGKTHSNITRKKISDSMKNNTRKKESIENGIRKNLEQYKLKEEEKKLHPENFMPNGLSRPIAMLDKETEKVLKYFPSACQAGKFVNISHNLIINCCKGKAYTSAGYKWRYATTSEANYDL